MFAPCKGIQDSPEFWISCRGFQIPDAVLCFRFQWNLDSGFQPLVGPGLVELYSRFQRLGFRIPIENISGFRIPQAKIFRISESGFPCMERCCENESFTMIISLLLMNRGETPRAVYLNLKILFETVDGSLGLSSDSSCDQLK